MINIRLVKLSPKHWPEDGLMAAKQQNKKEKNSHTNTHTHIVWIFHIHIKLSFVTKGSILDAAGVLNLPMPEAKRVEQNTYGNQSFLRVK